MYNAQQTKTLQDLTNTLIKHEGKGILKKELKPDITFNLLQSQDKGHSFKSLSEKVATIFANRPNEMPESFLNNTNTFSIYNIEGVYRYIINTFESAK